MCDSARPQLHLWNVTCFSVVSYIRKAVCVMDFFVPVAR